MNKEVTDAWCMTSHLDLYHLITERWAVWWYFGFQLTDRSIQQCMHLETSTEPVYSFRWGQNRYLWMQLWTSWKPASLSYRVKQLDFICCWENSTIMNMQNVTRGRHYKGVWWILYKEQHMELQSEGYIHCSLLFNSMWRRLLNIWLYKNHHHHHHMVFTTGP